MLNMTPKQILNIHIYYFFLFKTKTHNTVQLSMLYLKSILNESNTRVFIFKHIHI